jgi:hypothetical protein
VTVSVLLRLAKDALAHGRLAGHVEVVETGQRMIVRDADELVDFLRSAEVSVVVPERSGQATDASLLSHRGARS